MMKKISFWLIALGLVLITFRYDVMISLTEETSAPFDVLPDFIGYLLMLIGLLLTKKYTDSFRPAVFASAIGMIQSVIFTFLTPNYGMGTGFKIASEIVSGVALILFVLSYTYGIKQVAKRYASKYDTGAGTSNSIGGAPKRSTLGQLAYVAGLYGPIFAAVMVIGILFNVLLLSAAGSVSAQIPISVSLGVIIFGILEYAFLVLIIILNFQAMGRFKRIKFNG